MPVILGLPNPEDFLKAKCSHCFAKIGYTPSDIKISSGVYMGEFESHSYIVCPNCHKNIRLER